jgi:hypothetical protein
VRKKPARHRNVLLAELRSGRFMPKEELESALGWFLALRSNPGFELL